MLGHHDIVAIGIVRAVLDLYGAVVAGGLGPVIGGIGALHGYGEDAVLQAAQGGRVGGGLIRIRIGGGFGGGSVGSRDLLRGGLRAGRQRQGQNKGQQNG